MTLPIRFSARHVVVGVLLGLAVSAAVLAVYPARSGTGMLDPRAAGPLLSDCDRALEELVIHYTAESADVVTPVYRDFLGQLPAEVTVYVVCPDRPAFDQLVSDVGSVRCRLEPVDVGHPITCWSRDRWLALEPAGARSGRMLLCPRGEAGAGVWPAREGDRRVAGDLAAALRGRITATRSHLYFDGGDFVADSETVFVTPAVLRRNLQQTVATPEELHQQLEARLGRPVVLLEEAPDHHAGMFMMAVGNRTVAVGDPVEGRRLWEQLDDSAREGIALPGGPDFSEATVARFEAVARQCRDAGYRVVRMPTVLATDGRTYLTYLNVILDQRDGRRIVYLPLFSNAGPLNDRAAAIWTQLGYEVRPVDCTTSFRHFGSLRCLVNVLGRGRR